jgi:hypothetical protein
MPASRRQTCDGPGRHSPNLDDTTGTERRDPERERRCQSTAAVTVEERRQRAFLLVRVGVEDMRCRVVFEVHFESHTDNVRRSCCGSIEGQPGDHVVDGAQARRRPRVRVRTDVGHNRGRSRTHRENIVCASARRATRGAATVSCAGPSMYGTDVGVTPSPTARARTWTARKGLRSLWRAARPRATYGCARRRFAER